MRAREELKELGNIVSKSRNLIFVMTVSVVLALDSEPNCSFTLLVMAARMDQLLSGGYI